MATTTPRRLSRNTLARFLPDHESIVAFENLINEVAETLPASTDAAATAANDALAQAESARALASLAVSMAQSLADSAELAQSLVGQIAEQRDRLTVLSRIVDSMAANYATRYDQDSATPTLAYLGKAPVGSATSAAAWQIQKLVFGVDGDVTVTWANGSADFNTIWDDRASLTYS
jgi:hypothetical protein